VFIFIKYFFLICDVNSISLFILIGVGDVKIWKWTHSSLYIFEFRCRLPFANIFVQLY